MEAMQSMLTEQLRAYILVNNPDLAQRLQEDYSITQYLDDKVMAVMPEVERLLAAGKPIHVLSELCLEAMTRDLRPSKFGYVREVIETEFPDEYRQLVQKGVVTFEVIQLLEQCDSAFELFDFSESTKDSRFLRYAVIVILHVHFN